MSDNVEKRFETDIHTYIQLLGKNTCGYFGWMWMVPFRKKKAMKNNYGIQDGLTYVEDLTAHICV